MRSDAVIDESEAKSEATMPIILWLLGVPLSIVILLMLFGVV
jgi:hypothetical protein